MTLVDRFVATFGVWEEAIPYLDLMFDEAEMRLVVAVEERAVTHREAAVVLGVAEEEAAHLVALAYRRSILDKEDGSSEPRYKVGGFDHFLDFFAKFDRWDEVPTDVRLALNARFLSDFVERQRPAVKAMMRGEEPETAPPNDAVLLLSEAEEMVRAAEHLVLQPCDCRRLGQACDRPTDTCLWMDDLALSALDRGQGRRLTHDEAVDVLRRADRRGLMHTGDALWRERGLGAICNCCACDCYPFRASKALGSHGIWPQVRYVAARDAARCNLCGACTRRCHFEALYHDGGEQEVGGKMKRSVSFDAGRCVGCGLCATGCPEGAIAMEPCR